MDTEGNSVTSFVPGETYDITLRVDAEGAPDAYGFQMVALLEDDSPATEWSDIGDNMQIVQIGNREYIEQNSPSESNEFKTRWTAPDEGSGNVTFYYSANAVNGNGSQSGDGGTTSQFKLFELTTSTKELDEFQVSVFPNPTNDYITISGLKSGNLYSVFDIQGRQLLSSKFSTESTLDLRNFDSGLYLLSIQVGEKTITKRIFKN